MAQKILNDPCRAEILKGLEKFYQDHQLAFVKAEVDDQISQPPQSEFGDLAFGCFQFSKLLKKSPAVIAQQLQDYFKDSTCLKAQPLGPYLNFSFSIEFLGQSYLAKIVDGSFLKQDLCLPGPKVMIEYSQPNTHKEIHVGHLRNACLGNALVNLYKACQFPVVSSTFPGDVGTHVAKCLWYLKNQIHEDPPAEKKGEWLGQIYSKSNLFLEDLAQTDPQKLTLVQQEMTAILKQLEAGSGEYFELWRETRQWSIQLMEQVYLWCGIQFDAWIWESDVDRPSIQWIQDLYHQGLIQKSKGALGVDLESQNLGFCMLLKSDGTGLYATKDLELARRKFKDHKIEKSFYVVDIRQELHFKQVFRVLEMIGFPQAKDCIHLAYNFVELPDGAMSSRKGNIVPLLTLVDSMQKRIRQDHLAKYEGEWSEQELALTARQVAQGAIKYGMLKIDPLKKIVFNLQEWLKIEGDSGPFVQYSCSRIQSLRDKNALLGKPVRWQLLSHPAERKLIQFSILYQSTLLQACAVNKPSILTSFVYDLARAFNYFYHECSVQNAGNEDLAQARLALSIATHEILKQGLQILGIPAPLRM